MLRLNNLHYPVDKNAKAFLKYRNVWWRVVKLIRKLISIYPVIQYGWVWTIEAFMEKVGIKWNIWLSTIPILNKSLIPRRYQIEIYTDASRSDEGAMCNGKEHREIILEIIENV